MKGSQASRPFLKTHLCKLDSPTQKCSTRASLRDMQLHTVGLELFPQTSQNSLTKSALQVALQKSIRMQICESTPNLSNSEGCVDRFVEKLTE